MDQALHLRERARQRRENRDVHGEQGFWPAVRVLAVTSGKGGVGKTNITVNLAMALSAQGENVLIMDADLGLANIDVLLGVRTRYNIGHVLSGERSLSEVIVDGPGKIKILPASSGVEQVTNLSAEERMHLLGEFENLDYPIDVMLIDTGAGISSNVMYFAVSAQHIIIVATPEPTSITDAYAVMKVLSTKYGESRFLLLPNNVQGEKGARKIYMDLSTVANKFLNISMDLLGYIPADSHIPRSVRSQKAVLDMFPEAASSQAFIRLAQRVMALKPPSGLKGNTQFMWGRSIKSE